MYMPLKINLHSPRSSQDIISSIIHVRGDPKFITELFIRAAKIRDPTKSLIQYTPIIAINRK